MDLFINIKYQDARQEVIENLKEWAFLCNSGLPSISELITSYTTSLIRISTNQPSNKTIGDKVVEAIAKQDEYSEFIDKYNLIINNLNAIEKELIINRYLKNCTIKQLCEGTLNIKGNHYAKTYLEKAYTNIMLMDQDIDFSLKDYALYKQNTSNLKELRKNQKQLATKYLAQLFLDEELLNINSERVREIYNILPDSHKQAFKEYIIKDCKLTACAYRKIAQTLFTFMFLHEDFAYSLEEYKEDMLSTQSGWEKCFNIAIEHSKGDDNGSL